MHSSARGATGNPRTHPDAGQAGIALPCREGLGRRADAGARPAPHPCLPQAEGRGSVVAGIGIPLAAEVTVGPGDLALVRKKDPYAHKGAGGEVLVVGGGPYQGAPYLAGLGALRAGADIVRVASPVFEPVPDLIFERLEGRVIAREHLGRLKDLARNADVVVMGNGLGDQSHDVMVELAAACRKAVVDADALRCPLPRAEDTIYTPHAGEFTRAFGREPPGDLVRRARVVKEAAGEGGQSSSRGTWISSPTGGGSASTGPGRLS